MSLPGAPTRRFPAQTDGMSDQEAAMVRAVSSAASVSCPASLLAPLLNAPELYVC